MRAAGPASPGVAELRPVFAIMQLLLDATDECRLLDALLPALRAAVAADTVACTTVSAGRAVVHCTPGVLPPIRLAAFEVHAGHDPLVVRSGHGGCLDDVAVRPGNGASGVYRPVGRGRQLAVEFPAGAGSRVYLAATRTGRGFTRTDRELLASLRPLLATAMARIPPPLPPGLTRREREVLDLLRLGLGDREIGHRLGISPRTVGKHLEHVYGKLGARGRVRALASWRGEVPEPVPAR